MGRVKNEAEGASDDGRNLTKSQRKKQEKRLRKLAKKQRKLAGGPASDKPKYRPTIKKPAGQGHGVKLLKKTEERKKAKLTKAMLKNKLSQGEDKRSLLVTRAEHLERKAEKVLKEAADLRAEAAKLGGEATTGDSSVALEMDHDEEMHDALVPDSHTPDIKVSIEEDGNVLAVADNSPVLKDENALTDSQAIEAQLRETSRAATETAAVAPYGAEVPNSEAEQQPTTSQDIMDEHITVPDASFLGERKLNRKERRALKKQNVQEQGVTASQQIKEESGAESTAQKSADGESKQDINQGTPEEQEQASKTEEAKPTEFLLSDYLAGEIKKSKNSGRSSSVAVSESDNDRAAAVKEDNDNELGKKDKKRKLDAVNTLEDEMLSSPKKAKKDKKRKRDKKDKKDKNSKKQAEDAAATAEEGAGPETSAEASVAQEVSQQESKKRKKDKKDKKDKKSTESGYDDVPGKSKAETADTGEQWNVGALEGGSARQEKFMRLLGGKTAKASTSVHTHPVSGASFNPRRVQDDLQRQYEAGLNKKFDGHGRRGLGA